VVPHGLIGGATYLELASLSSAALPTVMCASRLQKRGRM
jgi:hypothetical protein